LPDLARWLAGRRLVLLLLAFGLALRAYHYLRGRCVWHDEAALLVNVLERGFLDLLGPLRFHEAAPPLFLWLTKAASLLLGDGVLALRLVPFLASCAALLLLASAARHLLSLGALPWALLLFACSEQLAWHTCEAKPYAVDVLCAVAVLAVYVRAGQAPCRTLLLFAALAPLLIWASYPACFLLGGVLAAFLPALWRQRRLIRVWLCYGLLAAATAGAFLALLLGPVRAQHDPIIHNEWQHCMPDWEQPATVPGWVVLSSLEVCRYCCKPLGQGLALFAVVGAIALGRRRRDVLVLLVLPIALALLAACLHRYPYGGVRVMVYAAPAVVVLVAAGVPPTFAWLRAHLPGPVWVRRLAYGAVALPLLLVAGVAVERVLFVWPEANGAGAARWLEAHRRPDDPVTGNDWTHLYYFRRLSPPLRWPHDVQPGPRERLWVVYVGTEQQTPAARLQGAALLAPVGWRVCEQHEFPFTTVALFGRARRIQR
jgi:hypothetical protein